MCTSPRTVFQLRPKYQEGLSSPIYFNKHAKPILANPARYHKIQIPCTKCVACKRGASLQRAIQLHCELKVTINESLFLTLTYDDKNLPLDGSVSKKHMHEFHKAIRYYLKKNYPTYKYRYENIAEYGTTTSRAHYHEAGFNIKFPDMKPYSIHTNAQGQEYYHYTSETLNKLWKYGECKILKLTIESCIYIAQHTDKKIDGKKENHLIEYIHPITSEVIKQRELEFSTRSNRPGIGYEWFKKYGLTDLYTDDKIVTTNGRTAKIPKYFDRLLKRENLELYEEIKKNRKLNANEKTPEENKRQEKFNNHQAKINKTKRTKN